MCSECLRFQKYFKDFGRGWFASFRKDKVQSSICSESVQTLRASVFNVAKYQNYIKMLLRSFQVMHNVNAVPKGSAMFPKYRAIMPKLLDFSILVSKWLYKKISSNFHVTICLTLCPSQKIYVLWSLIEHVTLSTAYPYFFVKYF